MNLTVRPDNGTTVAAWLGLFYKSLLKEGVSNDLANDLTRDLYQSYLRTDERAFTHYRNFRDTPDSTPKEA